MGDKSFGNLRNWGEVLEKLEALARLGKLGDHQEELIRVLRFNDNWRLREAVLLTLPKIQEPTPALMDEVLAIMMRNDLDYDVRILAADALGKILCKDSPAARRRCEKTKEAARRVLDGIHRLLDNPQPPILARVLREARERIVNG